MNPLTIAALADAFFKYGPTVLSVGQKLMADIAAGRGGKEVTAEDFAELVRLANQTGEQIYARLGITPPPPQA
jgi:hypothetical protein